MREYRVRVGKFEGLYNIYNDEDEFKKFNPDSDFKIWGIDDPYMFKTGDWCQAEDGYFVQVLDVYLLGKSLVSKSVFIRFPMMTLTCYRRRDKGMRIPNFYAMYTNGHKTSASGVAKLAGTDNQKALFVAFMLAGASPYRAVKIAYKMRGTYTMSQINRKIKLLFQDAYVQEQLMKVISNIGERFKKEMTEDDFVKRIMKHLENTKAGSSQEFNALFFIGKTADYIEPSQGGRVASSRSLPDSEDAEFSDENEEPPLIE